MGNDLQEGHSNSVTGVAEVTSAHPSTQSKNPVQARIVIIHITFATKVELWKDKDVEIPEMDLNINAIEVLTDIPEWICILAEEIRHQRWEEDHLNSLMICDTWMVTKNHRWKNYSHHGHLEVTSVIDEITVKGKRIIIPASLHK